MSDDSILARVLDVVTRAAGPGRTPPDAGPDTPLGEDGFWLDSVDRIDVIVAAEQEFDVIFDGEADLTPEALATVGSLAALIRSKGDPATRPPDLPAPAATGLRALWRSRPSRYSRARWAVMLGLDALPWPWGEDILAGLTMVRSFARARRRRPAVAWASAQPGGHPWRVAAALCAFLGRWSARSQLLGLRRPEDLRRHLVVRGEEHLTTTLGGTILLGFHLGPPNADLALRILGHRATWIGWERRDVPEQWREAWRPFMDSSQLLSPDLNWERWPGLLNRARRMLDDGGTVYVTADGAGREVFRVPLRGGVVTVRAGWLTLHRLTGARVLPVLTHLEGHTQVVTVHPALPSSGADPDRDLAAWREILGTLLEDYVRRFPEQCVNCAFA